MITSLTEEQKSKFQYYIDKWIKIGLSTDRVDRPKAEQSIKNLYKLANLKEPKIVWLDDPIQGSQASMKFIQDTSNSSNKEITSSEVRSAGWSFIGGSLWPAFSAWADFFNVECNIEIDRNYLDLVENCGYYYCLEDVVFATERPTKINLDSNGSLHNTTGKSIEYYSGWGLYHLHGISVPEWIITNPERITSELIDKESNIEVRREMLNIFGADKYLTEGNYDVLDSDKDQFGRQRRLLVKNNGEDEKIMRVEVINSTIEPDKTYNTYYLPVHHELRPLLKDPDELSENMSEEELIQNNYLGEEQKLTCHNAVASTFGKLGKDYGLDGQIRQGDVFINFTDGTNKLNFRES